VDARKLPKLTAPRLIERRYIMKKKLAGFIGALALALTANFASAAPPECQVFCVTSPCTQQSDCPGGTCNFACPKNGCCVY
jgi:hypothetical protein